MSEAPYGLDLALEAEGYGRGAAEIGVHDFHGCRRAQLGVKCAINDPKPAAGYFIEELVGAGARSQWGGAYQTASPRPCQA